MTGALERVLPIPRAEFCLVLLCFAVFSTISVTIVLGDGESGGRYRGLLVIFTTIILVVITISILVRVLRPDPYLTLDRKGLKRSGLFWTCACTWDEIDDIGFGDLQYGLGPKLGLIGMTGNIQFGGCGVFAPWMRMRPNDALALLTRYWRHAKFGEPFEATP